MANQHHWSVKLWCGKIGNTSYLIDGILNALKYMSHLTHLVKILTVKYMSDFVVSA